MKLSSTAFWIVSLCFLHSVSGFAMGKARPTPAPAPSAAPPPAPTTPCRAPEPDAAGLFALVGSPTASVEDVQGFLRDHVVAVDAVNEQCETSFFYAIRSKKEAVFSFLYDHYGHPNLNALNLMLGETLYSYSLRFGSWNLISSLRSYGGTGLPFQSRGNVYTEFTTDLMVAAGSNTLEVVQSLLQSGQSVEEARDHVTALIFAARSNPSVEVVRALIRAGTPINAGWSGGTALMTAVSNPREGIFDIVQALLEAGADVNRTDGHDETALMLAVLHVDASTYRIVRRLIEAGAEVNRPSGSVEHAKTALMYAAVGCPAEVIQLLVQSGADLSARSDEGKTALDYARDSKRSPDVLHLLGGP